jgi:hypothetical protein
VSRVFSAFGFCVVAATLLACGQSSLSAPQPPPRDIETRATPPRARHEVPRLIAPPPAYGNKIVLAHAPPRSTVN